MEETYATRAIVLKRVSFRERDSQVMLYSGDHGLVSLIARGTKCQKSKMAGHLEPATLVNIMVVRGRQWDYVGGVATINAFVNVKQDYDRVFAATRGLAAFIKMVKPEASDQELFQLLFKFLDTLDKLKLKFEPGILSDFFILKLLSALGYCPELYQCFHHKIRISPGSNFFDLSAGGLICSKCPRDAGHLTISNDCIKILRLALNTDFSQVINLEISRGLANEASRIIDSYYKYQQ